MRCIAFWIIAPIAAPVAAVLFVGTLALIWLLERWLPLNPRLDGYPDRRFDNP